MKSGDGMGETGPGSGKTSDLKIRFLSALVLGPVVLAVTAAGGPFYALLVLIGALLVLMEWFTITGSKPYSLVPFVGYAALAIATGVYIAGMPSMALVAVLLGSLLVIAAGKFTKGGRWAGEGVIYSGLALFSLLLIRDGNSGALYALFLLIVVWATDIFAYFIGRALGGPKLWVRISPKKTWSGAIGGMVVAGLLGAAIAAFSGEGNLLRWLGLALVLSVVSQGGDMLESAIKRRFNVKDSSALIPGHGGILDRVDGLIAAAIAFVLIGLMTGGTLTDPLAGLFPD